MDEAQEDVLAYFAFPASHRVKLHSTNTLERLNKEVKRRANVVGILRLYRCGAHGAERGLAVAASLYAQHSMADIPGATAELTSLMDATLI